MGIKIRLLYLSFKLETLPFAGNLGLGDYVIGKGTTGLGHTCFSLFKVYYSLIRTLFFFFHCSIICPFRWG